MQNNTNGLAVANGLGVLQLSGSAVANVPQSLSVCGTKKRKRSEEAKIRRAQNKKQKQIAKKEQNIHTFVPKTEGERRALRFQATFTVLDEKSVHFHYPDGQTIFRVLRQAIPATLIDELTHSTEELAANLAPPKNRSKRKKKNKNNAAASESSESSYHFGVLRRYRKKPAFTVETKMKQGRRWLLRNNPLFDFVATLFKQLYPETAAEYLRMCLKRGLTELFPDIALHLDADFCFHIDRNDCPFGLCIILPFGDFTRGILRAEEINANADLKVGDLAILPSALLTHGNLEVEGLRRSLVFFCDRNLLFPAKKQ
jgi:hypothetical protein